MTTLEQEIRIQRIMGIIAHLVRRISKVKSIRKCKIRSRWRHPMKMELMTNLDSKKAILHNNLLRSRMMNSMLLLNKK